MRLTRFDGQGVRQSGSGSFNRLLTLPRGNAFEPQIRAMGDGIETPWAVCSADEAEWQSARARLKEAVSAFTAAVRLEVQT